MANTAITVAGNHSERQQEMLPEIRARGMRKWDYAKAGAEMRRPGVTRPSQTTYYYFFLAAFFLPAFFFAFFFAAIIVSLKVNLGIV